MNNLHFKPGDLYDEYAVSRTYTNFGRLQALKYTNIRFLEQEKDSTALSAYVLLTKNKSQSVSFEVDGTNSAGDLGAGGSVSYNHRNLFRGSEAFMLKLRGAYEAVSGLQGTGYNQNYIELGAEATINFPRFLFPFLSVIKVCPATSAYACFLEIGKLFLLIRPYPTSDDFLWPPRFLSVEYRYSAG